MKLTLFLLCFGNICLAQSIPNQTNAITVRTPLANSVVCQKLVDLLRQQAWNLDQQDHRVTAFVTHYKPAGNDRALRLVATVRQGTVLFRGESAALGATAGLYPLPVVYSSQSDPVGKTNFEVMNQFALRLKEMISGSSVDYTMVSE
ncbi:hypothetical protein [Spirosoma koreense]